MGHYFLDTKYTILFRDVMCGAFIGQLEAKKTKIQIFTSHNDMKH